jgi:hypothetical protein
VRFCRAEQRRIFLEKTVIVACLAKTKLLNPSSDADIDILASNQTVIGIIDKQRTGLRTTHNAFTSFDP